MNLFRTLFSILVVSFLVTGFNTLAQPKQLTLEDAAYVNRDILPSYLRNLDWCGNSDAFTHISGKWLIRKNVKNNNPDTLLDLGELNIIMKENEQDTLSYFPSVKWLDNNQFYFSQSGTYYLLTMDEKQLRVLLKLPEDAENIDFDPKNMRIAFTRKNNLYIAEKDKILEVTKDENAGIVNGQEVHRREFGIEKGTFWSPNGNLLAFYRKDETMVADYPLVNIDTRIATVENTKYPMAGETSHQVTLGIYKPETKQKIFMRTGEPADQYLTTVTWSPDEKFIYIALLNRDQNHLKLNKYSVETGALVKTLFEEKHAKYVEPEDHMHFNPANPNTFIWFSERDGFQHMYLYDTDGNMIRQLTSGNWVVTGFYGFDPKGKYAFFSATKESPLQDNIYSVEIKSGKVRRLTHDHGSHHAVFQGNMKYFIDSYSSTDIASEYKLYKSDGDLVYTVLNNDDPLKDYNLGKMEIFSIKSEAGDDLYCRMIKPPDFDPEKKYPVFIYVYGGPHAQLITDSWLGGARVFLYYMAQQGYIVFTLDNRGSANRGFAFENVIFRNLGLNEVSDQMKGVEYLKNLEYVDSERIGIDGWSYGGFMTISMMVENPGVFKTGTAGGPVIDWKYYEVMYGERYMDTPQDNPEGYKSASLLEKADQLKGRLLIFHGTMDPTVVWQNSLAFLKKCIENGIIVDYFVYPGHEHNVRGKDRVHLYKKIAQFHHDYL